MNATATPQGKDCQLWNDCKAGDNRACNELYARCEKVVIGRLQKKLAVDWHTGEDCLQDAWKKMLTARPEIHTTVAGWLYSCASNRAKNHFRRNDRARAAQEFIARRSCRKIDLNSVVRDAEIRDAVTRLDAPERDAIEALYFDGLTFARAAFKYGYSVGKVRQAKKKGFSRLKRELAHLVEPATRGTGVFRGGTRSNPDAWAECLAT